MRLSLDASRATTRVRIALSLSNAPDKSKLVQPLDIFFPTAYVYLTYEATYVGS